MQQKANKGWERDWEIICALNQGRVGGNGSHKLTLLFSSLILFLIYWCFDFIRAELYLLVFHKVSSFQFSASVACEETSMTRVKAVGVYLSSRIDIIKWWRFWRREARIFCKFTASRRGCWMRVYMLESHQWLLSLPQKRGVAEFLMIWAMQI